MSTINVFGILLAKIATVSNKVKNILSGIVSITNVNNKLHYEFTDGTDADFDVTGDISIDLNIDYDDGHLKVS